MIKPLVRLICFCMLLVTFQVQAQDSVRVSPGMPYKMAVGLQFNNFHNSLNRNLGLSFKYFLTDKTALELNANGGYGSSYGTRIGSTLLLQHHFRVFNISGLRWYAGAGVNLDVYKYTPPSANQDSKVAATPTLISTIGLEYKLPKLPITLSSDLKLGMLGLTGKGDYNYFDKKYIRSTFSIRYTFHK